MIKFYTTLILVSCFSLSFSHHVFAANTKDTNIGVGFYADKKGLLPHTGDVNSWMLILLGVILVLSVALLMMRSKQKKVN